MKNENNGTSYQQVKLMLGKNWHTGFEEKIMKKVDI